MSLTLGSLFDGIGGFPLAGEMCGIRTLWSSEIEPFPLKVTAARFPDVKQLGSVTDINGAEIDPVDIITFGSPCQDLSVAGKQLGIHEGQRSNLFFEAIRIIKEMRYADFESGRPVERLRPRFAVWENVPGAFSSNGGKDFQAVLQALCEIREGIGVHVPEPKKGKWLQSGCIMGDGWSIAWRVYDAQYWGVPQRRKRIYLIADFASERAGEILFERESVCGDSAESGAAREGTAADAEGGVGGGSGVRCYALDSLSSNSMKSKNPHSGFHEEQIAKTLDTRPDPTCNQGGNVIVEQLSDGVKCLNPWDCQSKRQHDITGCYPTLQAYNGGGGRCDGVVYPINTMVATRGGKDDMRTCFGIGEPGDPQFTISAAHEHGVCYPNVARTLAARHDSSPCVDRGQNIVALDCRNFVGNDNLSATLQAKANGGQSLNYINPVVYDARGNGDGSTSPTLTGDHENRVTDYTAVCVGNGQLHQMDLGDKSGALNCMHDQQAVITTAKPPRKYIVRRLTPTECARLQGFPDEWCEGLGGSDSAIYKAYGNGLALPCAYDVLCRIAKEGGE